MLFGLKEFRSNKHLMEDVFGKDEKDAFGSTEDFFGEREEEKEKETPGLHDQEDSAQTTSDEGDNTQRRKDGA